MNIFSSQENLVPFLQFVGSKKREFENWRYLHVYKDVADGVLPTDELLQLLAFHFQKTAPWVLTVPQGQDFLVVTHKETILSLNNFEKAVLEQFQGQHVRTAGRVLDAAGLENFSKIIAPYVPGDQSISSILYSRMKRTGNRLMVLDDDDMVIKQLEKLIGNFGHVMGVKETDNFFQRYTDYAPDVLFLDIHLKTARGDELLENLMDKVDPHAHVIMISSDSEAKMVMKTIKTGGAKGYVVKPFNRNSLYQHLLRCPTVALRSGAI